MSDETGTLTQRAESIGRAYFGPAWSPTIIARAPGRIEVIGNHVDYNGGPVIAAAIDREICVVANSSSDAGIRVVFGNIMDSGPHQVQPGELVDWRIGPRPPQPPDYLRGVIASLNARGISQLSNLDVVVYGNLPAGLGISSSAALSVALTLVLARPRPSDLDLILIAQEAEHRLGSPCGTMDQSASIAGGLIVYSGADDSVQPLSADLGDLQFLVVSSGVERSLATSAYPERVRESQLALAIVRQSLYPEIQHLAAIVPEALNTVEREVVQQSGAVLGRRVRHVVTESQRVRQAVAALARSDWPEIGRLMTASGESSSCDYAIGHPAVDEIVKLSLGVKGVHGARMMGGGEGGAALVLVHRDAVPDLEAVLERDYFGPRRLNELDPKLVLCTFAKGASLISV